MDEIETSTLRKEGKTTGKQRATPSTKSKTVDRSTKKHKNKTGSEKVDEGKAKPAKNKMKKKKKGKKVKLDDTSGSDSDRSDDDSAEDDSDDSSDPDADADRTKKKGKESKAAKKAKQKKKAAKSKKKSKKEQVEDDSDTDDSLSVGSSAADESGQETSDDNDSSSSPNLDDRIRVLEDYMSGLSVRNSSNPYYSGSYGMDPAPPKVSDISPPAGGRPNGFFPPMALPPVGRRGVPPRLRHRGRGRRGDDDEVTEKTTTRPEFKRVDWVWDTDRYTYKLQDTAKASTDSQYEGYVFHVRRTFDHEGKYRKTFVDIKSKLLRECLQDVIKNINGVSLVDEIPKLDPNMLFL